MQHSAYLSLGSNIQPHINIPKALKMLSEQLTLLEVSSAWHTKAVGTSGPDFVNLAAHVLTYFDLKDLKRNVLYKIETDLGRVRTLDKFAPRPIDLDITLFDGNLLDANLCNLDYLILPLSELLPLFVYPPCGKTLRNLAGEIRAGSSAATLDEFPDYRSIEF